MKNINLLFITLFLLVSCGGLKEAGKVLRNEKAKTTDEFLVKKRNPLELPPDYNKIPEPGTTYQNKDSEEEKIKKILKAPNTEISSKKKSSSIEESVLNRISKWLINYF